MSPCNRYNQMNHHHRRHRHHQNCHRHRRLQLLQFTPPKVVKDEEVIKPPPEVKQIEEAKVDVKTVEGTKDIGIVAPPSEEKGTQVVAAPVEKKEDPDKIFTKVEIEASFPGRSGSLAEICNQSDSG